MRCARAPPLCTGGHCQPGGLLNNLSGCASPAGNVLIQLLLLPLPFLQSCGGRRTRHGAPTGGGGRRPNHPHQGERPGHVCAAPGGGTGVSFLPGWPGWEGGLARGDQTEQAAALVHSRSLGVSLPWCGCCSQLQPLLEQMLAAILEERRPAVLNTLVDQADNTLLHWAVARGAVPLAELLLGMVSEPRAAPPASRAPPVPTL